MGRPGALSGAPPGTRRRKLAVAAVSSFAALLAAEVAARKLFGVPLEERLPIVEVQANPTRGYEMVPDRDHYTYLHPVHVNHLGLRGPDLPEKAPGECRILCLGDSLVYGQGVADPDTIPAALEAELSGRAGEAHRIVRVVNGGVRGYDTAQERALLEELGDRIRPDVVVLFWYPNDLEKPRIEAARDSLARSGPVAYDTDRRMEGTALWTWRGRQLLRRSALVVRLRHVWAGLADRPLPPEEVERGLRRLDQDLGRIQAWASERGVVCVVVALPVPSPCPSPQPGSRSATPRTSCARRSGDRARARVPRRRSDAGAARAGEGARRAADPAVRRPLRRAREPGDRAEARPRAPGAPPDPVVDAAQEAARPRTKWRGSRAGTHRGGGACLREARGSELHLLDERVERRHALDVVVGVVLDQRVDLPAAEALRRVVQERRVLRDLVGVRERRPDLEVVRDAVVAVRGPVRAERRLVVVRPSPPRSSPTARGSSGPRRAARSSRRRPSSGPRSSRRRFVSSSPRNTDSRMPTRACSVIAASID
jgi:hypothetical protein